MREGDDAVEPLTPARARTIACSVHAGRRERAMKDLTVTLENRPGRLADLGEATGRAGVNIEGVCGTTEGQGVIHILVEDPGGGSWWRTRPPRAPP
jgi:hypothetical protein